MGDTVNIGSLKIEEKGPFFVIAGPCVIEDEEVALRVASFLREASEKLDIPVIFKTSYDKANRTSVESYRGPGIEKGLEIISRIKQATGLPVLSDVHGCNEVEAAAEVLDVIQIPAFLSRQTDLLVKAGKTGLPINIKKGQFVSPVDFKQAVVKVLSTENRNLLLTDTCRVESIPELEINQDEVRCSHGATMGPPDKDQIFYLKSRGIPENEAIQLLVEGFMEESLKRVPASVLTYLREQLNERLKGGWTFE